MPAQLPVILSITRGEDFAYKFRSIADTLGTPLALSGCTASFDLVPNPPEQPEPTDTFAISTSDYIAYASSDNSLSILVPGDITATIPAGIYRAWLYITLLSGSKIMPVVADVIVEPSGVAP